MEEKTQDKYQEPVKETPVAVRQQDLQTEKPTPAEEKPNSKEQDILELERQLAQKKSELVQEKKFETEPAKETETETETENQPLPSSPPSTQSPQPVQPIKDLDKESQIKVLCDLAFEKGLDEAIEAAKQLNNPYILDEFHDTLVDELYKRLVEKGKLEQM
jgi:hypothetical protein